MESPPKKKARIETRGRSLEPPAEDIIISATTMLLVPPEIIFRQVQEKPLLTRAEAQCFLRISFLAQEMDSLVQLAESMLLQRTITSRLGKKLEEIQNPMARPLRIISTIYGNQTVPALRGVQRALSGLLAELSSCSTALRQSAEQNWSVSESLVDAMVGSHSSSQVLAEEKRNLAELEEEMGKRIEALVSMTMLDCRGGRQHGGRGRDSAKDEEEDDQSPGTTRRNLFGHLPPAAHDPWKESFKSICAKMFALASDNRDGSHETQRLTAQHKSIRTNPFTQPGQDSVH